MLIRFQDSLARYLRIIILELRGVPDSSKQQSSYHILFPELTGSKPPYEYLKMLEF